MKQERKGNNKAAKVSGRKVSVTLPRKKSGKKSTPQMT